MHLIPFIRCLVSCSNAAVVAVRVELGCEEHSHGRLVAPTNNIHVGGWERSVVGILFAAQPVAQISDNHDGFEFDREWQRQQQRR